jgi:uncharacterized glyoxalase superfamily protein PhnB
MPRGGAGVFWGLADQQSGLVVGIHPGDVSGRVVPTLRYRNIGAAVDWLCRAFGFRLHEVVRDGTDRIIQAQLALGDIMVMLLPVGTTDIDRHMAQPDEIGGAATQSSYFVVPDPAAHYAMAMKAGATVVLDIGAFESGGQGYSCRDHEGHIWSFGSYDPWLGKAIVPLDPKQRLRALAHRVRTPAIAAGVAATLGALGPMAAGWILAAPPAPSARIEQAQIMTDVAGARRTAEQALERAAWRPAESEQDRAAKETAAEQALREARDQVTRERAAREHAERSIRQVEERYVLEKRAKDAAERAAGSSGDQISKERSARDTALRTVAETRAELARERDGKQKAEKLARDTLEQLNVERAAKEAALRAAREARQQLVDAREEPEADGQRGARVPPVVTSSTKGQTQKARAP